MIPGWCVIDVLRTYTEIRLVENLHFQKMGDRAVEIRMVVKFNKYLFVL